MNQIAVGACLLTIASRLADTDLGRDGPRSLPPPLAEVEADMFEVKTGAFFRISELHTSSLAKAQKTPKQKHRVSQALSPEFSSNHTSIPYWP